MRNFVNGLKLSPQMVHPLLRPPEDREPTNLLPGIFRDFEHYST
ncbi:MAG: hypothetical protein VYC65_04570 [Chloroflexota bacterium]|nr:hypothetical protein [Chloroflexota bacterium]